MAIIRIILSLFIVLVAPILAVGQAFEGTIRYKNESISDTAYVTYNVSKNLIRIDETSSTGQLTRSTIVNLGNKTVTALDPLKKLYTDIYPKPANQFTSSDFEINRTGNQKMISGYKCYHWRVKNKSANTEISYWVAEDNFGFFDELLKTLPLADNQYTFFLSIPQSEGFLPLDICERTLLRDIKNKLYLLDIKKQPIEPSVFEVPVGYSQYQASR